MSSSVYSMPALYDSMGKPGWTPPQGTDAETGSSQQPFCPLGIPLWVWILGGAVLLWWLWPTEEKMAEEITEQRPTRRRRRRAA